MVKKIDKKAFTLIEVLVVVAIIGILALLAIPRFIGHTQKAELVRIQHDVKAMEKEIGAKLINGDDSFNEWESNSKDLNQLVQDKELFENEGVAKEVEPTDGTYKVIPKEYKDKINTKLKGTFYANSGGKVYYEPGEMPGYSDEEIADRINPDDAKWVEKGNWGTNGYFVRDADGNGVVYAIDPQQPIIAPAFDPETEIFTNNNPDLTSLRFLDKTILPKDSSYYFAGNYNLTTFDTKNLDTSNVTDMSVMFGQLWDLTSLDVSNFDTSKVTNMSGMFVDMYTLKTLDVSKFDTANVTDMSWMFGGMQSLTALDVSKFDTSNVTNMNGMFADMYTLKTLDVSKFDTANVTNMAMMFKGMWALTSLDVSNLDTSNVTNMSGMFSGSSALTTLDVSNFNTSNVTDVAYMFGDRYKDGHKLTPPDTSNFDTSKMTNVDQMFNDMLM